MPPNIELGDVLVGRQREVERFGAYLAQAAAGRSQIVAIAGESGIGKTRLVQHGATVAAGLGFETAWATFQDGAWHPAYFPWISALEQQCARPGWLSAMTEAPGWVPPLWNLVRSLQDHFPGVPSLGELPLSEGRYRLAEAIGMALHDAALQQPLMLVIDDLQWSDDESLRVLQHLALGMRGAQLVIALTIRDDDPGAHPLIPETMSSLRRSSQFAEIHLTGLNRGDTAALMTRGLHEMPQRDMVTQVHELTSGNPFYVRELVRHLAEGEGAPGDAGLTALEIPASLRQVVNLRLQRLSPSARQMVHTAAVCSGAFDFPMLQGLTGLDDAPLLDAIDEALAAHLIVSSVETDAGERYEFAHLLVRRALYESWSPSRRARLHRALAESLIQLDRDTNEVNAPAIAVHYHASLSMPGAAAGVPYAMAAARSAKGHSAPEQAATYMRIARDLAQALPAAKRAAIAIELSLAEIDALWLDAGLDSTNAALQLMADTGATPQTMTAFIADAATGLHDGGQVASLWHPLLYQGLALGQEDNEMTWARLTLLVERFEPVTYGTLHGARWLGTDARAAEIALASGDESLIARSMQPWDLWDRERTQALSDQMATWKTPAASIRALTVCGADWLYHHGDFRRAQAHFENLMRVSSQQFSVPGMAEASVRLGIIHTTFGNLAQAEAYAARATALVDRLGTGHRLKASLWWLRALIQEYRLETTGEVEAFFLSYLSDPATARQTVAFDDAALTAHLLVRSGQVERGRQFLEPLVDVLGELESRLWLLNGTVALAGSAAWMLEASDLAGAIRDCATGVLEAGHDDFPCCSTWLTVARMSVLLGDSGAARDAFARARGHLLAAGQRPLGAIVDLDEASMLARGTFGFRLQAHELAMEASAQFADIGMTSWQRKADDLVLQLAGQGVEADALPGRLTSREVDVVQLIARGLADREVGEALFISTRTVNTHVRNILAKTELRNRSELTNWAAERGLGSRSQPSPPTS